MWKKVEGNIIYIEELHPDGQMHIVVYHKNNLDRSSLQEFRGYRVEKDSIKFRFEPKDEDGNNLIGDIDKDMVIWLGRIKDDWIEAYYQPVYGWVKKEDVDLLKAILIPEFHCISNNITVDAESSA